MASSRLDHVQRIKIQGYLLGTKAILSLAEWQLLGSRRPGHRRWWTRPWIARRHAPSTTTAMDLYKEFLLVRICNKKNSKQMSQQNKYLKKCHAVGHVHLSPTLWECICFPIPPQYFWHTIPDGTTSAFMISIAYVILNVPYNTLL